MITSEFARDACIQHDCALKDRASASGKPRPPDPLYRVTHTPYRLFRGSHFVYQLPLCGGRKMKDQKRTQLDVNAGTAGSENAGPN